ncbi:hypothetical protein [Lysinibacillus xylanilyticus]|uniref:hypothetical protein n=1 Tax=Lysinibacillus xylanilyticus TaxID=582475 RepID=UPI0037F2EACD
MAFLQNEGLISVPTGREVGHEGVITGCDALSLRSSIADPRGVAQSTLQSTTLHRMYLLGMALSNLKTTNIFCATAKRQQQHNGGIGSMLAPKKNE